MISNSCWDIYLYIRFRDISDHYLVFSNHFRVWPRQYNVKSAWNFSERLRDCELSHWKRSIPKNGRQPYNCLPSCVLLSLWSLLWFIFIPEDVISRQFVTRRPHNLQYPICMWAFYTILSQACVTCQLVRCLCRFVFCIEKVQLTNVEKSIFVLCFWSALCLHIALQIYTCKLVILFSRLCLLSWDPHTHTHFTNIV